MIRTRSSHWLVWLLAIAGLLDLAIVMAVLWLK
jgi:hypothetical protein